MPDRKDRVEFAKAALIEAIEGIDGEYDDNLGVFFGVRVDSAGTITITVTDTEDDYETELYVEVV